MPIDPNIALAGQPVANPLDTYGKALQLSNLAQQRQLGQQQIQSGQLQLQQQQQQMNDQKAIRQAFADSQGDSSQILPAAVKNGVSGAGLLNLQKTIMTMREQVAKTSKAELDNQTLKNGQVAGAIQTMLQDPANLAQNLPVALGNLVKGGYIDPQTAAQIDIPHLTQMGNGDPIQGLKVYYGTLQSANDLASQAEKQSTIVKNDAQGLNFQASTAKTNAEMPGVQADADMKARMDAAARLSQAKDPATYAATLDQLPHGVAKQFPDPATFDPKTTPATVQRLGMTPEQSVTTAQGDQRIGIEKQNTAISAGRLNVERAGQNLRQRQFDATIGSGLDANGRPLTGDDLKAVASQDPNAVAIAEYRASPPTGRLTPLGQAQMRKVYAIDPTYDAKLFSARNKTALDYRPDGPSGIGLKAADTGLAHLGTIRDLGKALHNNDIPALSKVANSLGVQVGADPKVGFDTAVSMVAPEIIKAIVGAPGGEGERQAMQLNFSSSASPQQLDASIRTAATLLSARVEKSLRAYKNQMGGKDLPWSLSPESQQIHDQYVAKPAPGAGSQSSAANIFLDQNGKQHRYNGTGDRKDPKSWTEVK